MNKKGQLSIEFIMMMMLSFAMIFSFVYVIMHLSTQKTEQKTFQEINDLGLSLQHEFLLASELEDGYTRDLFVPETINGLSYSVVVGNMTDSDGYLEILFGNLGITYNIPLINGTIHKGKNVLEHKDGWLVLS